MSDAAPGFGEFELVIGVPEDYENHRCQYAREYVAEAFSQELVEAWVIQRTIPVEPIKGEPDRDYYEFGGNVKTDRLP